MERLKEEGLSSENCLCVCRDRTGAMVGQGRTESESYKWCRTHIPHCVIHRESLASKTLEPELKHILNIVIKMVNYIKTCFFFVLY